MLEIRVGFLKNLTSKPTLENAITETTLDGITQAQAYTVPAQAITPNGITQALILDPTVIKEGGINRDNTPLQESDIYTVGWKPRDTIDNSNRGRKTTALDTKGFRQNPRLFTHRLDAVVKLETIDVEKTIRDLTQILEYGEYMRRELEGDRFKTTVVKEKRGETIVIAFSKTEKKYAIHITTHDLNRIERFRGYVREILQQETYTVMLETYVRYHEKDEFRVALAILSLTREIGKRVKSDLLPIGGKFDYYLMRASVEYRGGKVVVKTYRHASYRKREKTDPEFHPKLEQLVVVKDASTTTPITEILRRYTPLVYTIAYTLNLKVITGEYERQHTTTVESEIDPYIQRLLRGIRSKIKAETIAEQQYSDKRMAIARLLDKGLRPVDIARLLGYSRQYITRIIKELVNQGVIIRVKRGVYKLNPKYKPAKEEMRTLHHNGDLREFLELIKENRNRVVKYNLNATPYIDVEESETTITRYIFSRIEVRETTIKVRNGKTYLIGKRDLEKLIKQILNET